MKLKTFDEFINEAETDVYFEKEKKGKYFNVSIFSEDHDEELGFLNSFAIKNGKDNDFEDLPNKCQFIEQVAIHRREQRKGYFKMLMSHFEKIMKDKKITAILLQVDDDSSVDFETLKNMYLK